MIVSLPFHEHDCCSVAQSCPTLCNSMDCSTPGFPVFHYLPEFAQTHGHWVRDAAPFSCCLQSFPASGSFPVNKLFASGGQNIGAYHHPVFLTPIPSSWKPPSCSLLLWTWLFWIPHTSEIMQCLSFCVWLLALVSSRSIYIVPNGNIRAE